MLHLWTDKKGEMLWLLLSFWISTFIVLEEFFPDHSFKKEEEEALRTHFRTIFVLFSCSSRLFHHEADFLLFQLKYF